MYIREGGFLPAPEEVLLCSEDISIEQVILFLQNGYFVFFTGEYVIRLHKLITRIIFLRLQIYIANKTSKS